MARIKKRNKMEKEEDVVLIMKVRKKNEEKGVRLLHTR